MTHNYRELCEELLGALEDEGHAHWPEGPDGVPLIEQARAALAAEANGRASVVGELSDEEIMELMPQQMHDDLAAAVRAMAEQEGIDSTRAKGVMRIMLNRHVVDLARAVLARYGHQPAPAEGEVAELVAWIRHDCQSGDLHPYWRVQQRLSRAADLLSQRHPAPVPVSERLPGPEDCDAEGRCWWFNPGEPAMSNPHIATSSWRLCRMLNGKPMGTNWLPVIALPLPATTHETESND